MTQFASQIRVRKKKFPRNTEKWTNNAGIIIIITFHVIIT